MKNNLKFLQFIILFYFFYLNLSVASEVFNFDVTEIEITENGDRFIGSKGGLAKSLDGTTIKAKNFDYKKSTNVLIASGNVEINDPVNNVIIFSDKITYFKNDEIISTFENSKALYQDIEINSDNFRYDKIKSLLNANGNVIIENKKEKYKIFSNSITYNKKQNYIFSKKNSKALIENGISIIGDNFNYKVDERILNANGNVIIEDKIEDYLINANNITYNKNLDKVFTNGNSETTIQSKYKFLSKNAILDRKKKELISSENSTIYDDNFNQYKLSRFLYFYDKKFLKGNDVEVTTNYLKSKSDKFNFSDAFIDFSNNSYTAKDSKITLHKEIFDTEREIDSDQEIIFLGKNDPRIYASSSVGNKNKVELNKAIFTSCKLDDNCPPWSIKAEKITHDRVKKDIIYNNAVLNIYDVPVFYFPKFFHPDPSVERRSGLLQPRLNNSNVLGSSLNLPYFHVISNDKDLTLKPTIFDSDIYMFQNEYRQENKKSSFIADFNYVKGYQSTISGDSNRNSIAHLFSKFDLDLGFKDFNTSKVKLFLEKVNNDTYLKVFENVLQVDEKFEDDLKDKNNLTSGVELALDNNDYNFTAGFTAYENLQEKNNDRYQYILPYYNYSTSIFNDNKKGNLNLNSTGRNSLSNTNNLRSTITNSVNYNSSDMYSKKGFINNFGIYFKNLNATGKNDTKYKSSLQSELLNIYEINTKLPLIKLNEFNTNYITPQISFRINPSDMKNHSTDNRLLTTDNIFDINRLGITDSYESGKSLTFGIDFKKEKKADIEKYLEVKLAAILRDSEENKIPKSSSANRRASNLFGSVENSFTEFFDLKYDFSLDNDFNKFEHNAIEAEFTVNNFVTSFNFLEKSGELGSVNTLENTSEFKFDDENSLLFKTRRNRKISLTEYYDLVYQYQNDCLTAGIKYRKTYYQDRDLKPKEDLFFTITLFPLTSIDQKIDQQLYN